MTTRTLTLADFLAQRIAADERAATKLAETDRRPLLSAATTVNHPARLLAECAAKRRIVELHQPRQRSVAHPRPLGSTVERVEFVGEPVYDETLRALASVYADHADYRAEWAL